MCGVLGVKGLNLYTRPLNKHQVHLFLGWQSTRAQPKCSVQNALRKQFDTQRQTFSWCKLALEPERLANLCTVC